MSGTNVWTLGLDSGAPLGDFLPSPSGAESGLGLIARERGVGGLHTKILLNTLEEAYKNQVKWLVS